MQGPPLRIVLLIPYDPRYLAFAVRSIMFARLLSERGHHVELFYRRYHPKHGEAQLHHEPFGPFVARPLRLHPKSWPALIRAVRSCDVVHFQKAAPVTTTAALLLSGIHGKPLHQDWDDDDLAFFLQTLRDATRTPNAPLAKRLRGALRGVVATATIGPAQLAIPRLVDSIGGASMALRQHSARLGAPPSAIFPARVGVDWNQFHPSRRDPALREQLGLDGPTVLYSGHFDIYDALAFFVAAMRTFVARAPHARCLVLGRGSGRHRLEALVRERGLADSVVMSEGAVPHAEMPRYVASCDIGAVPLPDTPVNRAKSSLTLLEYMASGLACVTNDVGDAGWMLGGGGSVAPKDDPAAFGEHLAELALDPERRAQLGKAARARAEKDFGWDQTVDYLEAAYRHAIAARGRAKR